jgi:hypothetical protein
MIEAAAKAVADNSVLIQRVIVDGGLVAAIAGIIKLIFTMGRIGQVIEDHGDRLFRIESDRDARSLAELNGYRERGQGRNR